MNIAITTTPEESKRIVQAGLQRRRDRHEAFESAMLAACSKNCAQAKDKRIVDTATTTAKTVTDKERKARAKARLKAMQEAQRKEREANKAVRVYAFTVLAFFILTVCGSFPLWATITMSLSLAVILAAYLYRIFEPLEMEDVR